MNFTQANRADGSAESTIDFPLAYRVWLIILSTLLGPSVVCSLLMLFWMSKMRDLWTRLTNHIIIANFLVNFIQVGTANTSEKNHLEL